MKKGLHISACCLALLCSIQLGGCTELQKGGQQATKDFKDNFVKVRHKIHELMTYIPEDPPRKQAVREVYCYQVMQDIMCYKNPQKGAEERLVAYQGMTDIVPEKKDQKLVLGDLTPEDIKPQIQAAPGMTDDNPAKMTDAPDEKVYNDTKAPVQSVEFPPIPEISEVYGKELAETSLEEKEMQQNFSPLLQDEEARRRTLESMKKFTDSEPQFIGSPPAAN